VAQFRCGDYAKSKAALLSYVELVQPLMAKTSGVRRQKYALSVALMYSRLAVAANRSGATEDRAAFLAKARDVWASRGDHPTDSQIDELVRERAAACPE